MSNRSRLARKRPSISNTAPGPIAAKSNGWCRSSDKFRKRSRRPGSRSWGPTGSGACIGVYTAYGSSTPCPGGIIWRIPEPSNTRWGWRPASTRNSTGRDLTANCSISPAWARQAFTPMSLHTGKKSFMTEPDIYAKMNRTSGLQRLQSC